VVFFSVRYRYERYGKLLLYIYCTSILNGVPLFVRARLLFMVLHKLIMCFLLQGIFCPLHFVTSFFIRDLDLGDQNLKLRFVFEGSVVPQIGKIKSSFRLFNILAYSQNLCGGGVTPDGAHSCIFFRYQLNDRNIGSKKVKNVLYSIT
jgi:hypothetical protein